ncbi:hypothetical protein ES703_111642 [subsurface metagenome]
MDLTNEALADMLDIHPVSWYRIKRTGKFNAKFLLNAQKILSDNVPKGDKDVMPKRHQATPGQNLRGLIRKLIAKVTRLFHTDIFIGG